MPDAAAPESRPFEADVAKLLHLMVHSVYSDRDVFLRELVSNAADACEKLRFEAIETPSLLGDDPKPRIVITADKEAGRLVVEDNGVGMSRDEMAEALGTIARSGTRAFMDRLETAQSKDGSKEGAQLIGQFGVGFYSVFMVADRVEVASRRAGSAEAALWASDGKGAFTITELDPAAAPARGTRVTLHLMEDARTYAERWMLERIVKEQSGHVPVPISLAEAGAEPEQIADGAALWARPKAEISKEEYADFYRGVAGQFDEPALVTHYRAEGRHEYVALAFTPSTPPFDLFDPDRKGRMKLYVRRVFITDDAELLPRWLRFVRGLVDSSDLPLNVSREMIQQSPVLAAIRKGLTNRVLGDLEKLAENEPETFAKVWEAFGPVIKEGIYEDYERQAQLLTLARFRSTASSDGFRTLKDYVADLKENQTAIYYLAGGNPDQLRSSPHLEGFAARGVEVLLLTDPVDSFWVTTAQGFEGKPFKSASQGAADLGAISAPDAADKPATETSPAVADLIAFAKTALGDAVSDVRASDRLTSSAVCLVAPDYGLDRQLEKILAASGQSARGGAKPILEINATHALVAALAEKGASDEAFRDDAVRLLFDEARILDGERPADPRAFSDRLARMLERALR
ncbi:molecular chaperone HtpG [Hansschlegelia zhihuaiae]|uniref:Chaperone protein HtpG n=1 Tax=Hansschlegelia zhihuaiae TaxID=405005 RepID=A0A4Q0M924_9HYPH|nr:molecular chaperone HtpG [Hansschlegelia zhihuaiae]RXF69249.1 molecular chaperone HtpG [Hansschlegelia zhihuaiae]